MNIILQNIYKTKFVEDSEGNLINPFPASILYEKGLILYDIIKKTKAKNTLEIGMAYGLSSLFILQAHRDNGIGIHTAIDPMESTSWKSIGLLNVRRAGLEDLFKFYGIPSYIALPKLLIEEQQFDFVFIDGNHTFDYTLVDFFYTDKLLNIGGYVMLDDLWMPSIRKVLAFILRNRNFEVILENRNSLKTFSRKIKNKIQNPLTRDYSQGFTHCLLRKISEDNRKWDDYKSF